MLTRGRGIRTLGAQGHRHKHNHRVVGKDVEQWCVSRTARRRSDGRSIDDHDLGGGQGPRRHIVDQIAVVRKLIVILRRLVRF